MIMEQYRMKEKMAQYKEYKRNKKDPVFPGLETKEEINAYGLLYITLAYLCIQGLRM